MNYISTEVEVFKTNVEGNTAARTLARLIHQHFPGWEVNFDLEDCDKILRIAGQQIDPEAIIRLASGQGYKVEILSD